jgi:hypothetical protein
MAITHTVLNVYNPSLRDGSPLWLIKKIEQLREESKMEKDSSKLIYACFESRNLLENLEFHFVYPAFSEGERPEVLKSIRKADGIRKTFEKIEKNSHDYQIFLKALCLALNMTPPPYYNFKTSQQLKSSVNDYCHIYAISNKELTFGSDYIKTGFKRIEEILIFLKESKIYNGFTALGTPLKDFDSETLTLYNKWKERIINNEKQLIIEVKALIDKMIKNTK